MAAFRPQGVLTAPVGLSPQALLALLQVVRLTVDDFFPDPTDQEVEDEADGEDEAAALLIAADARQGGSHRPRVSRPFVRAVFSEEGRPSWWENVDRLGGDFEFQVLFRFNRAEFDDLVGDLLVDLQCHSHNRQHRFDELANEMRLPRLRGRLLRARPMVALFLLRMTSRLKLAMLATQFNVSVGTASNVVEHVLHALVQRRSREIVWPNETERDDISDELTLLHGPSFEFCVGAVDGSTFEIARPSENQGLFYNHKYGIHCLKVRASVAPLSKLPLRPSAAGCSTPNHVAGAGRRLADAVSSRRRRRPGQHARCCHMGRVRPGDCAGTLFPSE